MPSKAARDLHGAHCIPDFYPHEGKIPQKSLAAGKQDVVSPWGAQPRDMITKRLQWCLPFSLPPLKLQAGGPIWASEMKMGMNLGMGWVAGGLGLGEGMEEHLQEEGGGILLSLCRGSWGRWGAW